MKNSDAMLDDFKIVSGNCHSTLDSVLHQTLNLTAAPTTKDSDADLSLAVIPPWRQYDHHCWMPTDRIQAQTTYQPQLLGVRSDAVGKRAPSPGVDEPAPKSARVCAPAQTQTRYAEVVLANESALACTESRPRIMGPTYDPTTSTFPHADLHTPKRRNQRPRRQNRRRRIVEQLVDGTLAQPISAEDALAIFGPNGSLSLARRPSLFKDKSWQARLPQSARNVSRAKHPILPRKSCASRRVLGLQASNVNGESVNYHIPNPRTRLTSNEQEGYLKRHQTIDSPPTGYQKLKARSSARNQANHLTERESKKRRRRTGGVQKPRRRSEGQKAQRKAGRDTITGLEGRERHSETVWVEVPRSVLLRRPSNGSAPRDLPRPR
ncbi:hypothetical protein RF11_04604 [Thelohanellus kitauei]|uniref:Uncharacterized protein n=1 Tax=Thelohanellus kitauei TaxID=669202 RepID=A0A0C2J1K7_THEKT|nr:hypothetical protein RF11_04604 [Thelohanellus kitauei]